MKNPDYPPTIVALKPVNRWKGLISIAILSLLAIIVCPDVNAQSKYVKKYRPIADSLEAEYGVPASVILGVAILESGSCSSPNCKLLNNHFGIKGKNNLLKTKGVKTAYKQYADARASYLDFCKLLKKKKYYKKLKGNMDYKLWIDAISKAGYSTIPEYWKSKVTATIQKNKLAIARK